MTSPSDSFSFLMSSTLLSNTELSQPDASTSDCDIVVLTTYFVTSFMPGHESSCFGQYPANILKVFWPNRISVDSIHRFMNSSPSLNPISANGAVQPPYLNPSASSSFDPPGACMMPSRVINSCSTILLDISASMLLYVPKLYSTNVDYQFMLLLV